MDPQSHQQVVDSSPPPNVTQTNWREGSEKNSSALLEKGSMNNSSNIVNSSINNVQSSTSTKPTNNVAGSSPPTRDSITSQPSLSGYGALAHTSASRSKRNSMRRRDVGVASPSGGETPKPRLPPGLATTHSSGNSSKNRINDIPTNSILRNSNSISGSTSSTNTTNSTPVQPQNSKTKQSLKFRYTIDQLLNMQHQKASNIKPPNLPQAIDNSYPLSERNAFEERGHTNSWGNDDRYVSSNRADTADRMDRTPTSSRFSSWRDRGDRDRRDDDPYSPIPYRPSGRTPRSDRFRRDRDDRDRVDRERDRDLRDEYYDRSDYRDRIDRERDYYDRTGYRDRDDRRHGSYTPRSPRGLSPPSRRRHRTPSPDSRNYCSWYDADAEIDQPFDFSKSVLDREYDHQNMEEFGVLPSRGKRMITQREERRKSTSPPPRISGASRVAATADDSSKQISSLSANLNRIHSDEDDESDGTSDSKKGVTEPSDDGKKSPGDFSSHTDQNQIGVFTTTAARSARSLNLSATIPINLETVESKRDVSHTTTISGGGTSGSLDSKNAEVNDDPITRLFAAGADSTNKSNQTNGKMEGKENAPSSVVVGKGKHQAPQEVDKTSSKLRSLADAFDDDLFVLEPLDRVDKLPSPLSKDHDPRGSSKVDIDNKSSKEDDFLSYLRETKLPSVSSWKEENQSVLDNKVGSSVVTQPGDIDSFFRDEEGSRELDQLIFQMNQYSSNSQSSPETPSNNQIERKSDDSHYPGNHTSSSSSHEMLINGTHPDRESEHKSEQKAPGDVSRLPHTSYSSVHSPKAPVQQSDDGTPPRPSPPSSSGSKTHRFGIQLEESPKMSPSQANNFPPPLDTSTSRRSPPHPPAENKGSSLRKSPPMTALSREELASLRLSNHRSQPQHLSMGSGAHPVRDQPLSSPTHHHHERFVHQNSIGNHTRGAQLPNGDNSSPLWPKYQNEFHRQSGDAHEDRARQHQTNNAAFFNHPPKFNSGVMGDGRVHLNQGASSPRTPSGTTAGAGEFSSGGAQKVDLSGQNGSTHLRSMSPFGKRSTSRSRFGFTLEDAEQNGTHPSISLNPFGGAQRVGVAGGSGSTPRGTFDHTNGISGNGQFNGRIEYEESAKWIPIGVREKPPDDHILGDFDRNGQRIPDASVDRGTGPRRPPFERSPLQLPTDELFDSLDRSELPPLPSLPSMDPSASATTAPNVQQSQQQPPQHQQPQQRQQPSHLSLGQLNSSHSQILYQQVMSQQQNAPPHAIHTQARTPRDTTQPAVYIPATGRTTIYTAATAGVLGQQLNATSAQQHAYATSAASVSSLASVTHQGGSGGPRTDEPNSAVDLQQHAQSTQHPQAVHRHHPPAHFIPPNLPHPVYTAPSPTNRGNYVPPPQQAHPGTPTTGAHQGGGGAQGQQSRHSQLLHDHSRFFQREKGLQHQPQTPGGGPQIQTLPQAYVGEVERKFGTLSVRGP